MLSSSEHAPYPNEISPRKFQTFQSFQNILLIFPDFPLRVMMLRMLFLFGEVPRPRRCCPQTTPSPAYCQDSQTQAAGHLRRQTLSEPHWRQGETRPEFGPFWGTTPSLMFQAKIYRVKMTFLRLLLSRHHFNSCGRRALSSGWDDFLILRQNVGCLISSSCSIHSPPFASRESGWCLTWATPRVGSMQCLKKP